MLVFPDLRSQAIAQLPSSYQTSIRVAEAKTVSNKSFTYLDEAHRYKVWHLRFQGLTDEERSTLDGFYRAAGGRLRTFLFVDPFDNLFADSGLDSPRWTADPQLLVRSGEIGPKGLGQALLISNSSMTAGRFRQILSVPGWFRYTHSIHVRSISNSQVTLYALSGDNAVARLVSPGSDWSRKSLTFARLSQSGTLEAGVEIGPLTEVCLYGAQLECTAAPTNYKETSARSGIHLDCRFGNDILTWQSEGINSHSTQIEIITRISQ
jgi:hypothetical protein